MIKSSVQNLNQRFLSLAKTPLKYIDIGHILLLYCSSFSNLIDGIFSMLLTHIFRNRCHLNLAIKPQDEIVFFMSFNRSCIKSNPKLAAPPNEVLCAIDCSAVTFKSSCEPSFESKYASLKDTPCFTFANA